MQSDEILSAYEKLYESLGGYFVAGDFVNFNPIPNRENPLLNILLTNMVVTGEPILNPNGLYYNYVCTLRQYSDERLKNREMCQLNFKLYDVKSNIMTVLQLSKLLFENLLSICSVYTLNFKTKVNPYTAPSFDDRPTGASGGGGGPPAPLGGLCPANSNVWEALNRITGVAERLV